MEDSKVRDLEAAYKVVNMADSSMITRDLLFLFLFFF